MGERDDEELSRLQEYREQVVVELEKRREVVRAVELRISQCESVLDTVKRGRSVLLGDVASLRMKEATRRRNEMELRELRKVKEEAAADLARAQARLQDVESELQALLDTGETASSDVNKSE
jgi:hypothetical protein